MIGIIGFGKMGEAIALGLKGLGEKIGVFDIDQERVKFAKEQGLTVFEDNVSLVKNSSLIILAVKPQVIKDVLDEIKTHISSDKLVVSIAAGVRSDTIKEALGIDRVVRVMPNTPALVGEGAIVLSFCGGFTEREKRLVTEVFRPLGEVFVLDEVYMDAVTALSGSGPAYVFLFLEALSDAGVKVGLSRDVSLRLALQTLKGSLVLFERKEGIPRKFIDMVTSPGGTTISALHTLEINGFKGIIMSAVEEAYRRSKELGG